MKRASTLSVALLILVAFAASPVLGQSSPESAGEAESRERNVNPYGTGLGVSLLLTNSGFGIGGFYQRAFSQKTSFIAEFSMAAGKDEREWRMPGYWGNSLIQNKANYLLVFPLEIGFQHRLFQESIRDNFRPYLQGTLGPSFGWMWPYFEDMNGNGEPDYQDVIYDPIGSLHRGSMQVGLGGSLSFGAFFGFSRRSTQAVRLGYAFSFFPDGIQLLTNKPAQKFFGTPTISILFGKLW